MGPFVKSPEPPYYIAVFSAIRTDVKEGYDDAMKRMLELAEQMDGYLGVEFAGDETFSITTVFWKDLPALEQWKTHPEPVKTKEKGKELWYKQYRIRIAKVEADYGTEIE